MCWDWGRKEEGMSKLDMMQWVARSLEPGTSFVFDSLYGPREVLKWLDQNNFFFYVR